MRWNFQLLKLRNSLNRADTPSVWNAERELEPKPERLRIDYQIGLGRVVDFLERTRRQPERDRLVEVRHPDSHWTEHP